MTAAERLGARLRQDVPYHERIPAQTQCFRPCIVDFLNGGSQSASQVEVIQHRVRHAVHAWHSPAPDGFSNAAPVPVREEVVEKPPPACSQPGKFEQVEHRPAGGFEQVSHTRTSAREAPKQAAAAGQEAGVARERQDRRKRRMAERQRHIRAAFISLAPQRPHQVRVLVVPSRRSFRENEPRSFLDQPEPELVILVALERVVKAANLLE